MDIYCSDTNIVGEVEDVMFSVMQQGPANMLLILKNVGVNTLNYRFQEYNGTAWVDLGVLGTDYNNTLSTNQVKTMALTSTYPQVKLVANASGGAMLQFSVTRYFNRASGGALPILTL